MRMSTSVPGTAGNQSDYPFSAKENEWNPQYSESWFWFFVRCSLLVASLVRRHHTLSWFSAKEKKRMNEIPNIVIPAPGGQRVGTPPPQRLRSISLNLRSPAVDPLWIHSIQLVPPWIQYSMWTHLLYHHSGCWPLCTSTVPVSPPLRASIVPPPLCTTTLAVGPIALSLNAARGHHTHLQSSKWTPSGFVFIQLSFQFFCG